MLNKLFFFQCMFFVECRCCTRADKEFVIKEARTHGQGCSKIECKDHSANQVSQHYELILETCRL